MEEAQARKGGPAPEATRAVRWRAGLILTAWTWDSGCLGSSPALTSCVSCGTFINLSDSQFPSL